MKKKVFGVLLAAGLGLALVVGSAADAGHDESRDLVNDEGGGKDKVKGDDVKGEGKGKGGAKGKGGHGKGKGKDGKGG